MLDDAARKPRLAFHIARGLVVAGLAYGFGTALSGAQDFPTGNANERDQVTNYLCVTPQCDVLRHPTANCLCTKDNPAEMRLDRLKLTCSTKEGGQWVQCPVPQRYGN